MSKSDGVLTSIYQPFANNPARNRTTVNERMYIRILTELAVNRFKWTGLPSTVDERFLEMTLFYRGLCVFFKHDKTGRFMALRGSGSGVINMYDNPTKFIVLGNSMVHETLDGDKCVPIWANAMRIPDSDIVFLYAKKLADIDRTIEINILSARHSHVLTVPESQRLTYVNIMRQQQEGQPAIFGDEMLDMSKIQAFDIGIDEHVILNLQVAKTKMWSECMTLLGINNANQDKKERLVSDEVSANDEQVSAAGGIALKARKRAAAQMNAMFGLSIGVGWDSQSDADADGTPEVD